MKKLWFILGLCSELQVYASLSITEAIVMCAAPFMFFKDYQTMKRDGIMPFFVLSIGTIIGCVISSIANHSPFLFVARGLGATYIISCAIIFSHHILRKDPNGFKWYFLGAAISLTISTYIFKHSVEVTMYGGSAADIMGGPTYWIKRLGAFIMLPAKGWYISSPYIYILLSPLSLSVFSLLTSTSGRASSLNALGFMAIALIGGRKSSTMRRISKHFWIILCFGLIIIISFYLAYKVSAARGWLGEDAKTKYEVQTRGGGMGRLILGGRGDSFIGLLACRDKPIIGWGPWAEDIGGCYQREFMEKYGTEEDFEDLLKRDRAQYYSGRLNLIACHSYITEFWLWYGILGLLFILYLLFAITRYLKDDCYAVPQWFGWLACGLPFLLWGVLFSPFSDRVGVPLFVVACLMARAVRLGRFRLPDDMIMEIVKSERK